MTENLHHHPYTQAAFANWQERATSAPEKHQHIFERQLIYLLFFGNAREMAIAQRVLSHSLNTDFDSFLDVCFSSIHQAVSVDSGDQIAADPRSFFTTKTTGEHNARGGAGPQRKG